MLNKLLSTVLFMVLPFLPAFADHHHHHDIEGTYSVSGIDPVTGPYTGTAVITKVGPVYVGNWTFPDPSGPIIEPATGVINDGVLAFVYLFEGSYGVSTYEIHDHGKCLEGPWVQFGAAQPGSEKLKKISE